MPEFPVESVQSYSKRLNNHPLYRAIETRADLVVFMEHHVYSVWDFMSMIKYLQEKIAPTNYPWVPKGDPLVRRFINELVLEEESDQGLPAEAGGDNFPEFMSHFELYCHAMSAVGADHTVVQDFVHRAETSGIKLALSKGAIPQPSKLFTGLTFDYIASDKPHVVASAFALGREHVIPGMFRACLNNMGPNRSDAVAFEYYLKRHVHLDEDFHGPMSLRMLNHFIGDDQDRCDEAVEAAISAIEARLRFWDGVLSVIECK